MIVKWKNILYTSGKHELPEDGGKNQKRSRIMIIQSKRIWIAGQFMKAQLRIEEGIIQSVYNYGEKRPDRDFKNLRVVPGFLDIHTHGAYGYDKIRRAHV